jgi:signal transduction histidine kinase
VRGAAEAAVDDDGVLRHAFLRAGPAAAPYPHVALALLQAAGQAPAAGLATERGDAASAAGPWRRDERLAIRYLGPPGHIERIGVVDVLTGRSGPERLRDRWLLVGLTAQGLGDTLATPVNAMSQAMPGVEVIANTLQTLRSGQAVRTVEPRTLAAVSAVLAGLWVPLMSLAGPRRALPLTLAAVPLALLATPLALRGGWFASSVPWVLALLMAYPLWSWRRLERAMAGLDDELRHLAGEPLLQTAAALPMPAGPDPIAGRLQLLRRGMDTVRGARAFLADALEALPGAVLVGDAAGRVLLGNAGAAEVFETGNAAELQGLDLARLLAEFETPAAVDWATALAAAAGASHPARGPDGRDWLIHVAPTTLRGERCAVVVLSDLTPLKQAEREREEALAFVSHDLRSPAAAIVSLSRLRADGTLPMDDRAYLAQVQELASRTLSLADEFVRVLQAQSRPLQLAPVAVAALVQAGCGEQQAPAREAGVALVEQIDAEAADAVVQVDRLLVERALANLVGNAIRHSPRGGSVELRARLDGTRLRLRVSDQGPGLAAAQREAISRGHTAAVGDARGVGLGLQFVQRVAARHRGRLLAPPPAAGTGAVLELELPFPGNP